jgi:hypothetical protein
MSALCGVKQDAMAMLLEFILYTNFVEMLDDPKTPIKIPLLGDIYMKEDGKALVDFSPAFLKTYNNVKKGDVTNIADYFEKRWLSTLVDSVVENS